MSFESFIIAFQNKQYGSSWASVSYADSVTKEFP